MYKFISDVAALDNILRGAIKFTPVSDLNDPSEMLPQVNRDLLIKSLAQMRARGHTERDLEHLANMAALMQRLAPEYQALPMPRDTREADRRLALGAFDNASSMEATLQSFVATISSKLGVFCLTSKLDCLPMWAHYARSAAGVVVEFGELDRVFRGDSTGVLRTMLEMRYEKGATWRGITFEPDSYTSIFLQKFDDWRYECETRVIIPLDECREVDGIFLYDIPKECIRRIVLGWQVSRDTETLVREMAAQINPAVHVARAEFDRGSVRVAA